MKRLCASLMLMTLIVFTGCNTKSTPGGPGAASPSGNKPIIGEKEDTFSLSVPTLSTTLKQGESKAITIGIKRGKNFDEDVTLKFTGLPKGVTVDPANPAIKHGETDTKPTFKAADDAALGDFTIQVTGHPTKGTDAANEFKLKVEKK